MHFTKMHGLGNDYLYVYGAVPDDVAALSQKLSDRHFGAGADGMIFISPSEIADFRMRIFNADGSEAMMCGNGIRCVGKYVYDKGYTDKTYLKIETLSGIRILHLQLSGGKVTGASVMMGTAQTEPPRTLTALGRKIEYVPVSVGNPHAVIFTDDVSAVPLETLGPAIEHHPDFPDGVNVEFVQALSGAELRMRVWERGSGVTMACGTGSCASVAAAVRKKICKPGAPVSVQLDGGTLEIMVTPDGAVTMTGPAEIVYEGETVI
ncbi:MAG: diaminopimelate epimerase [Clostridia bacterium]|nr:diaminopimelate epimerase [Clostridia bacterium]